MPKKSVIKKNALAPTVLIAGGAGFIGSHLCETLLLKDARVVVLDNFKTGKENYIGHLIQNPKFAVFSTDISQGIPEEIESVDYIFHLAGLEEYIYSKQDVNLDSLLTNALGTKNLLDLATRSQAKFLLVSSTDVYQGMISQIDLKQYFGESSLEEKQYSQTEAKRFAEAMVWEYYKKSNTDVRIVRLPEVFGPRMDFESSGELGRLVKDLSDNRDLTVYGDGTEKQYYLYITDAVNGIIKALFNPNTDGRIYPLVDKEAYSPLEIVFLLKSLANRELKIEFKAAYKDISTTVRVPDTSNLSDLGWGIKTSFRDGVIKTLKWLGYDVNENTFKPAKFIDENRKQRNISFGNTVSTLADISEEIVAPKSNAIERNTLVGDGLVPGFTRNTKEIVNNKPRGATLKLPKIKFPRFQGPKISSKFAGVFYLIILLGLFSFTIFVGIPVGQTVFNAKRAVDEIVNVKASLTQLDASLSEDSSKEAFRYFSRAQKSLAKIDWVFDLAGKRNLYVSLSDLFSSLSYFSRFSYNFSRAITPYTALWEAIRPNTDLYLSTGDFQKAEGEFSAAKENLQFALSKARTISPENFPVSLQESAKTYISSINLLAGYLEDFFQFSSEIPVLLGTEGEKKYLILFQNSNEIRPTGGFIGSYATLILDKGKIKELNIDDVYNPDGQLDVRDIKFSPPEELQEFLGEDRAYIRNSNWNPDFPESADQILDLFFAINGVRYDGIFAVDLKFAESLLRITGPVFLTAYNEEITADNMYERAQYHSEFNYKDGSSQKKSFLTTLGSKLLERVFSLEQSKIGNLFEEMNKLLISRHVALYMPNTIVASMLNRYGWDGSIQDYERDFIYVVNSNVGGTKANYFVKNKMDYVVSAKTRDGLLRGDLTLTYEHTGQDNSWPGGPYTNYIRVYLPADVKLTQATYKLNSVLEEDIFDDVKTYVEGKYRVFAYTVKVNPAELVSVKFGYDLSQASILDKSDMVYKLLWQKQMGTSGDEFSFVFNPPFGSNVINHSADLLIGENTLTKSGELNQDQNFEVNLR